MPQLDLTGGRVDLVGGSLRIHVPVASLANLTSPNSGQPNVWWSAVWQFKNKVYFAKAESDGGGAPKFVAGQPGSYDRPGLTYYQVPTLLDYRNGTAVKGKQEGNEWVITVPASTVGSPQAGDVLESFTAFTMLDNGQSPFVAPGPGNIPTVVDATPAYNALLQATQVKGAAIDSGGVLPATGATTPNRIGSAIAARPVSGALTTSPGQCWPDTISRCACGCCASTSWA